MSAGASVPPGPLSVPRRHPIRAAAVALVAFVGAGGLGAVDGQAPKPRPPLPDVAIPAAARVRVTSDAGVVWLTVTSGRTTAQAPTAVMLHATLPDALALCVEIAGREPACAPLGAFREAIGP